MNDNPTSKGLAKQTAMKVGGGKLIPLVGYVVQSTDPRQ